MDMGTTQKAVVNALMSCGVTNDPCGYREVYMDNRYASLHLGLYLREKCKILMCGTLRKNRKGFDKELFDMSKNNSTRGDTKFFYDKDLDIAVA